MVVGQVKGNYFKDDQRTSLDFKVEAKKFWENYALIFKTTLGLGTVIGTSLFFKLRLMSFLIRRRMLSKKNYQIQMPVITKYQSAFKKSLSRVRTPNVLFIGGPSGIGKTESIKRMIMNQGNHIITISHIGVSNQNPRTISLYIFFKIMMFLSFYILYQISTKIIQKTLNKHQNISM